MLIWKNKNSIELHGKRFIYQNNLSEVATEFSKVDVTEEKPESVNVDAKKKEYITKLGKDTKAQDYQDALKAINERADLLKKKQDYFKAKLEAVNIINLVIIPTDVKSYLSNLGVMKKLETLAKLKADSQAQDSFYYDDAIKAIIKSNDLYLNTLITETRNSITKFNKRLASLNAPNSKVKISDLTDDAIKMSKKAEEFKAAKAKRFEGSTVKLTQEQTDIAGDYFAAFNLYNAKLANVQLEGSDDKEKVKEARDWLAGAESLQKMRLAKASATKAINAFNSIPDSVSSIDFTNFSNADYYKAFRDKLRADPAFNKEWTDAAAMEKTDSAKAIKLYEDAEKKYQALASSVTLLNSMMVDVNALASYDSKAERKKRGDNTAESLAPDRYKQVLNDLYAAAGELYNSPHLAGSKLSTAIISYRNLKQDSFEVEKGKVAMTAKLPDNPEPNPKPAS